MGEGVLMAMFNKALLKFTKEFSYKNRLIPFHIKNVPAAINHLSLKYYKQIRNCPFAVANCTVCYPLRSEKIVNRKLLGNREDGFFVDHVKECKRA